MTALRRLFLDHRLFAGWMIGATLLMKLLVPTGYMPVVANGMVGMVLCSGAAPARSAVTAQAVTITSMSAADMTASMPGMMHHQDGVAAAHGSGHEDGSGHQGKTMPCAFAGLSAPSLAAADPLLLALAIAFVIAAGFRRGRPSIARPRAFLRPPLRGPPSRT